jgi:hypothetical protein
MFVLAFTTAADKGRRALYATRSPDAPTLSHTALQCIGSQTCAAFWGLLHSYACLDLPSKDRASVPLQHPFLCRSVDGRVRFVPPPDLDFRLTLSSKSPLRKRQQASCCLLRSGLGACGLLGASRLGLIRAQASVCARVQVIACEAGPGPLVPSVRSRSSVLTLTPSTSCAAPGD